MSGERRLPGGRGRRGEAGYNLVFLMVLVTVLTVLVAAALPAWTSMAQREKEEELIFRGLQYAEAIRVFQGRFGRPPMRLEELVEVEPRSIRQLWKDPITGEAEWGLVFANAGVPNGGGPQGDGQPARGRELAGGTGLSDPRPSGGDPDKVTTGPIVGVYSLADGDAIKVFNGKERYSDWHFTVDLLVQAMGTGQQPPDQPPQGSGPGSGGGDDGRGGDGGRFRPGPAQSLVNPMAAGPPDLSSRWIGRPWPPEIEAQMNPAGQLQGGGLPGQPGPADGASGQGGQRRRR